MDRGAWWAAIHGVAKSQTRLHFHSSLSCIGEGNGNPLQRSWRIPGMGEPGGLLSLGSHRVGHDWSNLAVAVAAGKTTRPFRYDQNQIPYDYTVEVRNRFKGLDLIDRVPDELWTEVRDIVQETGIKTIPVERSYDSAILFLFLKEPLYCFP